VFGLTILVVIVAIMLVFSGVLSLILIAVFVLPLCIYIFDVCSRRRLLPKVKEETNNHKALRETGIRWLHRTSGRGTKTLDRAKATLPRTVADQSMFEELRKVEVPEGLVEPETVRNSKPGSTLGSIFAVIFSILSLIMFARITQSTANSGTKTFAWIMIPVMSWLLLVSVLSAPLLQKSNVLPSFWRRIGRGQTLKRGFVVGPGWIKFGNVVWNANTDMLLIRRHSFRGVRSNIDCMFVSNTNRRRITFSGIDDEDFRTLFGFWNVEDVRLEFIDSELS